MIRLNYENLSAETLAHLNSAQREINIEPTFEQKVLKAKMKWSSKQSAKTAKYAFKEIKDKLISMCSAAEICVYCEHNEATDIEHIYPKRLYPGKTFLWENHVLACGKCNTHYKKDKFRIFSPIGSTTIQDITPKSKVFNAPENEDILFINQRIEDPMTYLELDFLGKTFYFIERHRPGTRDYEKAKFTKDLLGLNKRDDLVQHRIAAFKYYKGELEKYVAVHKTTNMDELSKSIDNIIDTINLHGEFGQEKTNILTCIENRIKKHSHPSVWKEMIRQRVNLNETNHLFEQIPDALLW